MASAKPALRIGLEYGTLLAHRVDPTKVEANKRGDRGYGLCGAFCSFVYGTWSAATGAEHEICSQCEHMAGDDLAEARRAGRLF